MNLYQQYACLSYILSEFADLVSNETKIDSKSNSF